VPEDGDTTVLTPLAEAALRPLKRGRLYEQVAERLRELIAVQGLRPGDRLMSERDLAARLGVSRTSVRQALTALEVVGLLDVRHGGGVFLAEPPENMLPSLAAEVARDHERGPAMMEVREAIETETARLASRRRNENDVLAMRGALDAMRLAIAEGQDPAVGDAAFHNAIVAAARNPLLAHLWDELAAAIDMTRRASLARPGRPANSLSNHEAILAAIQRGDEEAASRAMRAHLRLVADPSAAAGPR
jgi:GntR family transcriptional regulator, transcriptional repressor for pyruvate dehydrogenase complex